MTIPDEAMRAAERAAVDAIQQYANHRGATAGAQQAVIDALRTMTGVGRMDLAQRIAQAAIKAAAPHLTDTPEPAQLDGSQIT